MQSKVTRYLLLCGIGAALLYLVMDGAAGTLFYPGYDFTSQQVSELSAIGAPSRAFWLLLGYPYALLMLVLGIGVWRAAEGRRSLRAAALLIVLFAATGLVWALAAPMHMRGTEFTDTDSLHIGFAVASVALILGFIGLGTMALGRAFRLYSAITVVAMLLAGAVVSTQIPAIAAGAPTPWMGYVERISVYGAVLWLAMFGLALSRRDRG